MAFLGFQKLGVTFMNSLTGEIIYIVPLFLAICYD